MKKFFKKGKGNKWREKKKKGNQKKRKRDIFNSKRTLNPEQNEVYKKRTSKKTKNGEKKKCIWSLG